MYWCDMIGRHNEVGYLYVKESPIIKEDKAFDCISNGDLREDEGKEVVTQCKQSIKSHLHHYKNGPKNVLPSQGWNIQEWIELVLKWNGRPVKYLSNNLIWKMQRNETNIYKMSVYVNFRLTLIVYCGIYMNRVYLFLCALIVFSVSTLDSVCIALVSILPLFHTGLQLQSCYNNSSYHVLT